MGKGRTTVKNYQPHIFFYAWHHYFEYIAFVAPPTYVYMTGHLSAGKYLIHRVLPLVSK